MLCCLTLPTIHTKMAPPAPKKTHATRARGTSDEPCPAKRNLMPEFDACVSEDAPVSTDAPIKSVSMCFYDFERMRLPPMF
jgi:hypothetical protein